MIPLEDFNDGDGDSDGDGYGDGDGDGDDDECDDDDATDENKCKLVENFRNAQRKWNLKQSVDISMGIKFLLILLIFFIILKIFQFFFKTFFI